MRNAAPTPLPKRSTTASIHIRSTEFSKEFPDYDENVAGPLLAEDIGLATLRERCPHFGEWLTRLEQLDAGGA